MVHLTVSPTLIEIGFGLNAKLTIEPATVFEVWAAAVVVGLAVVVVVGLAVVVVFGLAVVVVVVGLTVVVDPLVVLAETGGLVGWLVGDGWTVSRVD